MSTTPESQTALAVPENRNLAEVSVPRPGRISIDRAPRWLTSTLGIPHEFPLTLSEESWKRHPLGALAIAAADIARLDTPMRDYLVEPQSEDAQTVSVLIQGEPLPAHGNTRRVLLEIQDVTEIVRRRRRAGAIGAFHALIGQSLPMLELYHKIATYGPTDAPVLITGETGTGKELVARAMHERSKRAGKPFVAVNCSALTSDLFESELFGHEKGSFTGAMRQHRGRFERADGGTLFLDEIGEMPTMTQAKMLRALEEGSIERVGSEKEYQVDVRIVAATNVALEKSVQARRFRADLYHRLSVLRVHVPPLREREGDVPLLANHYLEVFNRRYGKTIRRITPEALRILEDYHWPGNVRELRNVIERVVIEVEGELLGARALVQWMEEREYLMPGSWNADQIFTPRPPIYTRQEMESPEPGQEEVVPQDPPRLGDDFWGRRFTRDPLPLPPPIIEARPIYIEQSEDRNPPEPVELTRENIEAAYRTEKGNLTRAATRLGVHKATLYRHMKRLDLSRENLEATLSEDHHG